MGVSVDDWMAQLASAEPTPGGGGAAAMSVAMGAGLTEMVCNLTIGRPRYAEREDELRKIRDRATVIRGLSLSLVSEDAAAFGAVMAAYGLPKDTESEIGERKIQIEAALLKAAGVALRTAELAGEVIQSAAGMTDGVNANVISDVAVAAASALAGLTSSIVNVEINVAALKDKAGRDELMTRIAPLRAEQQIADRVVASVRERIGA